MYTLINSVTLRGGTTKGTAGSILFGYRPAAVLGDWVVSRGQDHVWRLAARVDSADPFQLRQIPLTFAAPRLSKPRGFWTFPIRPKTLTYDPISKGLAAELDQPEG